MARTCPGQTLESWPALEVNWCPGAHMQVTSSARGTRGPGNFNLNSTLKVFTCAPGIQPAVLVTSNNIKLELELEAAM